jgi:hypothetical protein
MTFAAESEMLKTYFLYFVFNVPSMGRSAGELRKGPNGA